jgi:hypothetical protein
MPLPTTHTFHRQASTRIREIRPHGRDVEFRAQVVDAVEDMRGDLELDASVLVGLLLLIVDGGAWKGVKGSVGGCEG